MPVDNCTFWFEGDWSKCCYAHDLAYADLNITKLMADWDLMKCVAESGHELMSLIIFIGVFLFGVPFWMRARKK